MDRAQRPDSPGFGIPRTPDAQPPAHDEPQRESEPPLLPFARSVPPDSPQNARPLAARQVDRLTGGARTRARVAPASDPSDDDPPQPIPEQRPRESKYASLLEQLDQTEVLERQAEQIHELDASARPAAFVSLVQGIAAAALGWEDRDRVLKAAIDHHGRFGACCAGIFDACTQAGLDAMEQGRFAASLLRANAPLMPDEASAFAAALTRPAVKVDDAAAQAWLHALADAVGSDQAIVTRIRLELESAGQLELATAFTRACVITALAQDDEQQRAFNALQSQIAQVSNLDSRSRVLQGLIDLAARSERLGDDVLQHLGSTLGILHKETTQLLSDQIDRSRLRDEAKQAIKRGLSGLDDKPLPADDHPLPTTRQEDKDDRNAQTPTPPPRLIGMDDSGSDDDGRC